jgi:hypothetical protein
MQWIKNASDRSIGDATWRHGAESIFAIGIFEKYPLNILVMGDIVAEWLAREFTFLGIHFQNWMPLALAIVMLGVLFQLLRSTRRG